jgi:hypothetical protein
MKTLLLLAAASLLTSCAGFQRSYSVNYDEYGNITGGITITPMNQK